MNKYEITIKILDEKYINDLIISLVRQGYEVYYNNEDFSKGTIHFITNEEEVIKIDRED